MYGWAFHDAGSARAALKSLDPSSPTSEIGEAFVAGWLQSGNHDGVVDYGPLAEHCWNGDQERPNAISRLRYHQMYLDRIMARIKATAPKDADLTSWRY